MIFSRATNLLGQTAITAYTAGRRIMRIGSVGCEYYSDGRFMRIGYTGF